MWFRSWVRAGARPPDAARRASLVGTVCSVRETDSPEEEFELRREPSLEEKYDVPPETAKEIDEDDDEPSEADIISGAVFLDESAD